MHTVAAALKAEAIIHLNRRRVIREHAGNLAPKRLRF
jgi:hypothetical protein